MGTLGNPRLGGFYLRRDDRGTETGSSRVDDCKRSNRVDTARCRDDVWQNGYAGSGASFGASFGSNSFTLFAYIALADFPKRATQPTSCREDCDWYNADWTQASTGRSNHRKPRVGFDAERSHVLTQARGWYSCVHRACDSGRRSRKERT